VSNVNQAAATAKFPTSDVKASLVAGETQKVASLIQANPAYAQHPEIQAGVTAWLASASTVDQASQKLKAAHVTLTALIAALATAMAAWKRDAQAVTTLVNTASAGSAQAITGWGFSVASREARVPTLDAPTGLRAEYSRSLVLTLKWAGVRGRLSYAVQIGDGTPTGWGAAIPVSKASYQPPGLTPGQKVAFRVAVQRKNGMSNWSDMLVVTVR
jgi:hypothetical protein